MKKYPEVSIVMLNYNGRRNLGPILDKCIKSILATDYPRFKVLFVDNKSTDDSLPYVSKKYENNPRFDIVQLDRNYGFARANNIASKMCYKSKYLAFVNNDIVVPKDWLRKSVETLERKSHQKIVALSPIIYDKSVEKFIGGTYIEYPSGRYYIPLFNSVDVSLANVFDVDFPAGECFVIRKDIFDRIGGFDEQYFLYHDDGDLGWRLRLLGYRIAMTTDFSIVHFRSSTVQKEFELIRQKRFFEGNRLLSCLKNLESRSLLVLPIVEMATYVTISILGIFKKKYRLWPRGYLRAIRDILHSFNPRKRKKIQNERKLSDKELFKEYFKRVPLKGSKWLFYALYKLIA